MTNNNLLKAMDIIDEHKDKLGDGDYLSLCNLLKKVSDESTSLFQNNNVDIPNLGLFIPCRLTFIEPRVVLPHNENCGPRCRIHKSGIMNFKHILPTALHTSLLTEMQEMINQNGVCDITELNNEYAVFLHRACIDSINIEENRDAQHAKINYKSILITKINRY